MTTIAVAPTVVTVHRIEVSSRPGQRDALAEQAMRTLQQAAGDAAPRDLHAARIFLIEGVLTSAQIARVADELLTDPVTQQCVVGASTSPEAAVVEVHPLPGVMDPDAEAVEQAIAAMLGITVSVRTGVRFDMYEISAQQSKQLAMRHLSNAVIQAVLEQPYHPEAFAHGSKYELQLVDVPLRDLNEQQLTELSRQAHLFLSLEEMRAIQAQYRKLGREPRDIELETLAQTWSEHCVHKTLKSTVVYSEANGESDKGLPRTGVGGLCIEAMKGRPGHVLNADGTITIHNLLKSTVAAATQELIADGIDWCLSVFVDNAGIIAFDDEHAVCFKVETHNHPSAIEPYGGAATGVGGCIRDIIGTGLAAQPIANTDVFCVAHPTNWTAETLPAGVLHPRRILNRVVAGVRDYGNRMGIPTLNGAVWFDDNYLGNPLVYCGCVGIMPRDKTAGDARTGDRIVLLGGRTGRDGIHGATFSSAELTDTHADEFSHAVQIGNPMTEKKTLDAILTARDHESGCLYSAITDCGAGGLSSAVGEMGEKLGATVQLERVPLKYAGLSPVEIWISEAQERMVLAVPAEKLAALQDICELHEVDCTDLGTFGTADHELVLNYHGTEVGRLDMRFMHEGVPDTTRVAVWTPEEKRATVPATDAQPSIQDALLQLLAHPNIASKHWIIQQYDHEVQGRTAVKPLVGIHGVGPGDAAVLQPVAGSTQGLAIANGLVTGLRDDPYIMALAAIDECVRNLVCVGADPDRIAILDNFCWPGCVDPQRMASLVRAAAGCYDGAKAYRTPFISGKDSLNNQFAADDGTTIHIPPTLLISGFGIVPDVNRCVTMDAKSAGNVLLLVGDDGAMSLRGSHYASMFGCGDAELPIVDLESGPATARQIHALIQAGVIRSAHDVSDGGLLCAVAEMCIGGDVGAELEIDDASSARLYHEGPSRFVLEVLPGDLQRVQNICAALVIGTITNDGFLRCASANVNMAVDELREAWRNTLDW